MPNATLHACLQLVYCCRDVKGRVISCIIFQTASEANSGLVDHYRLWPRRVHSGTSEAKVSPLKAFRPQGSESSKLKHQRSDYIQGQNKIKGQNLTQWYSKPEPNNQLMYLNSFLYKHAHIVSS